MAKLNGNIPKPKNKAEADTLNREFRNSDYNHWQQMDFIVGYEIKRSNNPDCICKLCEVGAGRYPKSFKWTGWHDGCKCRAIPILKTEEEMDRDDERILSGKEPKASSVNSVSKIPRSVKEYVKQHSELKAVDWYIDNAKMF